jgi:hypothetical protein
MLKEIGKLERVRAVGLLPGLFADTSEKLLAAWRARAANMYPSDFRSAPPAIRLTLLAALCAVRSAEITDGLVGPGLPAGVRKCNVGGCCRVAHVRARPATQRS